MADLRIVDAPVLLQESITDDVKMPTGGLGNFSVRLGDILWYVITKEQLANKSYVDLSSKGVQDKLDEHIADKANPHQVTKAQVGLGNVDNTADIDKPVSNAVSSAIITATNDMATKTYVNQKDNLKADKANTLAGYGIINAYTKSEIDTNYGGVKTLYDKNVVAGAGANGWTTDLVVEDGLTQKQINAAQKVKNAELLSTKDFGCVGDGVTDDSQNLANAIKFAQDNKRMLDGLGLTYACHSVKFDSGLTFKNANLICNKYDADMVSVLDSGESEAWLENVEFTNVKINGKRELHTNIKAKTTSEDGGRHGFRIVRKTRNLKMTNCEAVNCATEGIIIYPKSGEGNNRIVDVVLTDCNFSGNRRHGGSSDSVNGITFTRVKCNNNGLDIDTNSPLNSGLRGDRFNGNLYGNGWDFEEYAPDYISTNITLDDCEMLQNAKMGVLIYTHGNTSETSLKASINIEGGRYDKGQFSDTDYAIIIRPTAAYTDSIINTNQINVTGVDFNGCSIAVAYCKKFNFFNNIDYKKVAVLQNVTAYTDVPRDSTYRDNGSKINFYFGNPNGELTYLDGALTIAPISKTVKQYYDVNASGYVDIAIVSDSKLGGIQLKIGSDGQTQTSFTDFNNAPYITFNRNGVKPLRGSYTLGDTVYRFETIYLNTAANVASDERIKKDIRALNDIEKLVAKDLKAEICIYRLKDNDDKLQIGVIAQKVVSIFDKHGLNALDYQVVHYDADIDRYSIVYEQLILFIVSGI